MAMATIATFPYHFAVLQRPVLEFSWPLALSGHFSPSLGRSFGLNDWVSFGIFCALILSAFAVRPTSAPVGPSAIAALRSRVSSFAAATLFTVAWVIALMATVPHPGRVVEILRFQASSMLGPDADERAYHKPWQRGHNRTK